jgi:Xaa-Pro dipeptidase
VIVIFNMGIPDKNFYHLSGIEEECDGVLVFGDEPKVLASPLAAEVAEQYVQTRVFSNKKEFWKLLKEETGGAVLGLNFPQLSAKAHETLLKRDYKVKDVSNRLRKRRVVKSRAEIGKMERACRIASEVMEEIREFIRPGVTELQLKAEMEYLAVKRGAGGFAFSTVVASGPRSAVPHATASGRRLQRGDAVVVDFGPTYKLYSSDMTRTFVLGSNREFEDRYARVLEAQERIIADARDGATLKSLQETAEGITGKLLHLVGHGVGLDVHEAPVFTRGSLRDGMVVAIEPGIYDGFGIRIEDVVAVGGRVLTRTPKDLDFARI